MLQLSFFDDYKFFDHCESIQRRKPAPANDNFYKSQEWLELRYETIAAQGGCCSACGRRGSRYNPIQVDHIIPRSKAPLLALEPSNLQVMCWECNWGKRNRDAIDWRQRA